MRYRKALDPSSPYSFVIDITNFENDKAKFTGTLTIGTDIYDWQGSYSSSSKLHIEATVEDVPLPAGFDPKTSPGSVDELDKITPIAHVGEGIDKNALLAGQDGAQYYGDRILHKVLSKRLNR